MCEKENSYIYILKCIKQTRITTNICKEISK